MLGKKGDVKLGRIRGEDWDGYRKVRREGGEGGWERIIERRGGRVKGLNPLRIHVALNHLWHTYMHVYPKK